MNVILDIIMINNVLTKYFKRDIYSMFLDDYCFEYYRILKLIYPDCKMVIQNNKDHCASLIMGNVYDVTGIRDGSDFFIADTFYENYVYSFYNKFNEEVRNDLNNYIVGKVKVKK